MASNNLDYHRLLIETDNKEIENAWINTQSIHMKTIYLEATKKKITELERECLVSEHECEQQKLKLDHMMKLDKMMEEKLKDAYKTLNSQKQIHELMTENINYKMNEEKTKTDQGAEILKTFEKSYENSKSVLESKPLAQRIRQKQIEIRKEKIEIAIVKQRIVEEERRQKLMKEINKQIEQANIIKLAEYQRILQWENELKECERKLEGKQRKEKETQNISVNLQFNNIKANKNTNKNFTEYPKDLSVCEVNIDELSKKMNAVTAVKRNVPAVNITTGSEQNKSLMPPPPPKKFKMQISKGELTLKTAITNLKKQEGKNKITNAKETPTTSETKENEIQTLQQNKTFKMIPPIETKTMEVENDTSNIETNVTEENTKKEEIVLPNTNETNKFADLISSYFMNRTASGSVPSVNQINSTNDISNFFNNNNNNNNGDDNNPINQQEIVEYNEEMETSDNKSDNYGNFEDFITSPTDQLSENGSSFNVSNSEQNVSNTSPVMPGFSISSNEVSVPPVSGFSFSFQTTQTPKSDSNFFNFF